MEELSIEMRPQIIIDEKRRIFYKENCKFWNHMYVIYYIKIFYARSSLYLFIDKNWKCFKKTLKRKIDILRF